MSSALQSPAPTLKRLQEQLEELQASLEPFRGRDSLRSLTATLEKRVERLASSTAEASTTTVLSGRLQSAQLQSSMAYILLDLIWILLKLNGTETQSHPVTSELKRVQLYLQKVHQADKRETDEEHASRAKVDGEKAKRFIKGALGSGGSNSAAGKRTIFAEDGSIEKVVDAGETEVKKRSSSGGKDDETESKKTKKTHKV